MMKTIAVENRLKKKIVKDIRVDVDKCTGCRACEMACSAIHAKPKYSSSNPARARIRVLVNECKDMFVPIRAGHCTPTECAGRCAYTINGKTYTECGFCKAACPSRVYFTEPDSGLPLKCDMCEADLQLDEPMCVHVCRANALTYTEREEVADQVAAKEELDAALERLAEKHGLQKMVEIVNRMSKTGRISGK
jgi:benzoyl-CoA reductase subunit BamC